MPSAPPASGRSRRVVDAPAARRFEGLVPIRYRLPNPPPIFVGRRAEIDLLAATAKRGPVCFVHGLGGLGKTSLVLRMIHDRLPADVERALFLGLRPSDPLTDARVTVIRACASVLGVTSLDWSTLLADGEALTTTALDLADEGGFAIVLDDMHHADPASMRHLLAAAARHGRRARWIGTTRIDPEVDELRGQSIRLGALSDAELVELAQACTANLHPRALARVVERALGSPWRAHALLSDRDATGDELDFLSTISPEAVRYVETLAALRAPLPTSCLQKIVDLPDTESRLTLQRRGVLESTGGEYRLHDVARTLVRRSMTPDKLAALERAATRALSSESDPASVVERLRLLTGLAQWDEADALLASHFGELVKDGYTGDLQLLLDAVASPVLARWRIRCVVELAEPTLLAEATEPAPQTPDDRLAWVRVLFLRGELVAVRERARQILESDEGLGDRDPSVAFRVAILLARSLLATGEGGRALALLESLPAGNDDERAIRSSSLIETYLVVRRFGDVVREIDALMGMRASLSIATRREVGRHLIVIFVQYGWLRRAAELLERWVMNPEGLSIPVAPSRFDSFHELLIQLGRCEFEKARRLLESLQSFASETSVWQAKARTMELVRRFAVGEFAAIDGAFDEALAGAARLGLSFDYGLCLAVRDAVAIVRGAPGPLLAFPPGLASVRGTGLNLARVRRAIRYGQESMTEQQQAWWEQSDKVLIGRAKLLSRMARIEAGIAAGAIEPIVPLAEETIAKASDDGWVLTELDVRQLHCEALLLLGRDEALGQAAGKLLELAVRCGSRRFEAHARFHALVARERAPTFMALELAAQQTDVAPDLARRARALLGCDAPLDVIDAKLVGVLAQRAGARCKTFGPPSSVDPSGGTFGIDGRTCAVWSSDGRTIDMSDRKTLFGILTAIAECDGHATKADLARRVWNIEDYHPLRDDKRIQVTVRKLRMVIEDDPSAPVRVVTTDEGYAFGTRNPTRWIARDGPGPAR
jgi:hypothetical protein